MWVDRREPLVVPLRLDVFSLGNTPIRPRLIEVGLLDCNLRFGLLQGGLCIDPLRLRLVELHLVVARIDQHQQLSGGNMLVVDKLQLRYPARHLRRHLGDVAVDERIAIPAAISAAATMAAAPNPTMRRQDG